MTSSPKTTTNPFQDPAQTSLYNIPTNKQTERTSTQNTTFSDTMPSTTEQQRINNPTLQEQDPEFNQLTNNLPNIEIDQNMINLISEETDETRSIDTVLDEQLQTKI